MTAADTPDARADDGRATDAVGRLRAARRWIETCVDPVAVGPNRKQAMLDYLDGKRAFIPDDITYLPRGDEAHNRGLCRLCGRTHAMDEFL